MWAATRRWFRRNRNTLLVSASVVAAGYVAGQYVLGKIQEARQRLSEERIAKDNLRRRFEQNQEDCTYTVLALLPTVRDEILAALPVEEITEQLQQERQERLKRMAASDAASSEYPSAPPSTVGHEPDGLHASGYVHASQMLGSSSSSPEASSSALRVRRSKAQLWQDMKINSIARALTLIYTLCLLTLLTRIQLNLLGRRTYLSSVVALACPPAPAQSATISLENRDDDNYENVYGNDFDTNRKYLTFSWWLLHRGSRLIMARVIAAVKEVFGPLNIREDMSLETLANLIMQVRKTIEGATEEERRSRKWLEYLLPPPGQETFVIRQSGMLESFDESFFDTQSSSMLTSSGASDSDIITASLQRLLDETSDLIDSPTFSHVFTRILDSAYSHLVDHRIATEAFKAAPAVPSGAEAAPRITEIFDMKCKLAHILPVFCKQAHAMAVGNGELDAIAGAGMTAPLENEYLAGIDRVHDLEAFAAVIYSSNFEFEVSEAMTPVGPEHGAGGESAGVAAARPRPLAPAAVDESTQPQLPPHFRHVVSEPSSQTVPSMSAQESSSRSVNANNSETTAVALDSQLKPRVVTAKDDDASLPLLSVQPLAAAESPAPLSVPEFAPVAVAEFEETRASDVATALPTASDELVNGVDAPAPATADFPDQGEFEAVWQKATSSYEQNDDTLDASEEVDFKVDFRDVDSSGVKKDEKEA